VQLEQVPTVAVKDLACLTSQLNGRYNGDKCEVS